MSPLLTDLPETEATDDLDLDIDVRVFTSPGKGVRDVQPIRAGFTTIGTTCWSCKATGCGGGCPPSWNCGDSCNCI